MAGTFNQSLQCTQDVFVGFQAPSPPVSGTPQVRHGAKPSLGRTGSLIDFVVTRLEGSLGLGTVPAPFGRVETSPSRTPKGLEG